MPVESFNPPPEGASRQWTGVKRVERGAADTLRLTTATDPDSAPAVVVKRANGEELVSGIATVAAGTGVSTFPLTAAETSTLDELRATWTVTLGGVEQVFTTDVEIVGGFIVSMNELRRLDGLEDVDEYPDWLLRVARTRVEQELENACGVAFAPRYGRERLNGSGTTDLLLGQPETHRITGVRLDSTDLTADELAEIVVDRDVGVLYRPAGWPAGRYNVVVEYEHGFDSPPGRVPFAAAQLVRYLLIEGPLDPRAVSVSNDDGTTASIVQAAVRGAIFALPEANAVVRQYRYRSVA